MSAWFPYPPATCVRSAWLTLPATGQTIPLESKAGGWFCTELDLGFPAIREVVSNRPDQDGVDDRTQFYGARAISAAITVLAGAGARIDDVADNFAPFMQPALRPQLHVILDRPGASERVITVRAAGYGYKVAGDAQRDIQLQWIAADPYLYSPTTSTATAWAGSSSANGRTYPLIFNRSYPAGGGTAVGVSIYPAGDLPVQPLLRIYGPITAPRVNFYCYAGGAGAFLYGYAVGFVSSFALAANQWVDVDTKARTAIRQSDPSQNVFSSIDFGTTTWPVLPPAPAHSDMTLTGSGSMSSSTQVQALWQDGFLT